jgi:hypothetical protein
MKNMFLTLTLLLIGGSVVFAGGDCGCVGCGCGNQTEVEKVQPAEQEETMAKPAEPSEEAVPVEVSDEMDEEAAFEKFAQALKDEAIPAEPSEEPKKV